MKSSSIVKKTNKISYCCRCIRYTCVYQGYYEWKKKSIIMNSFCNRYMCDGYKNMFYWCYYIDMIWKNQKLIVFCRWKQTGYWCGHHVELNISRRILTGCRCLFKCSLLLKLHILQLHLQLKLTCVYFTRTEKKSRILRKYMNFKGRIFI